MVQAEHMADFVDQCGKQVDPSGGLAAGIGSQPAGAKGRSKLGRFARRRVYKPAVAIGVGIDRNSIAIRLAKNSVPEVGDQDFEAGEEIGLGLCQAGGGPDPDGFLEDWGEGLIGQAGRGILCICSKAGLAAEVFGFIDERGVGFRRRTRRAVLISLRNRRILKCNKPPLV